MGAGIVSSSSFTSSSFLSSNKTKTKTNKQSSQTQNQYQYRRGLQNHTHTQHRHYGDKFIPNRSSFDLDMARYLLVDAREGKENKNKKVASPLKGAYRKHLAETTMMDRT